MFTIAEKEDLVNLLMRHAGSSSNSTPQSDFLSHPGVQTNMQNRDVSSMMQDLSEQCSQEQSAFTPTHVTAQCFPSTAHTLHNNDYLVSSLCSNVRNSGKSNN